MQVAAVQLASTLDSAENRRLVDARLAQLEPGHDLVVLPEATMHDFGSPDHDLGPTAEPLDGPFVDLLAGHARRLGATVVGGMFETPGDDAPDHDRPDRDGGDDRPFNTLVVLAPDGTLAATYRKIHLYDSFGYSESSRLRGGDLTPVVIEVAGASVGLMTCYDLRFPELAQALTTDGAQVLVVPAAWVAGEHKLHHWRTLLTARAVENVAAVVAAAQGGERYTGHSLVVDPWGTTLAEGGAGKDDLVTSRIDLDDVARARRVNPSAANRRLRAT